MQLPLIHLPRFTPLGTFVFDDGGRKEAGFQGRAGDCVTRAVAITTGMPYKNVHAELDMLQKISAEIDVGKLHKKAERLSKKRGRPVTVKIRDKGFGAEYGISTKRQWFDDYMKGLGFNLVPTMGIGTGCRTHLNVNELPKRGRLVVSVSRHHGRIQEFPLIK